MSGAPKATVSVRLSEAGQQRIRDRASRADVEFSHMVRRMLTYADRHMPEGWVPGPAVTTGTEARR